MRVLGVYTHSNYFFVFSPNNNDPEKVFVKKQLSIWSLNDLKKIISEINNTELLCKKNPQASKFIFFNFFSTICKKANNYS